MRRSGLGAATIILTRRRLSACILARADPLLAWIRRPWPHRRWTQGQRHLHAHACASTTAAMCMSPSIDSRSERVTMVQSISQIDRMVSKRIDGTDYFKSRGLPFSCNKPYVTIISAHCTLA